MKPWRPGDIKSGMCGHDLFASPVQNAYSEVHNIIHRKDILCAVCGRIGVDDFENCPEERK